MIQLADRFNIFAAGFQNSVTQQPLAGARPRVGNHSVVEDALGDQGTGPASIKARTCNVLSGVRHEPVCAADVSARYAMTVAALATR
jgi:hypothetical protein